MAKSVFAFIAVFICLIALIIAVSWISTGNDYFLSKVFSPKKEQVRYNTFKQSQAYNDGVAKDVAEYRLQYVKASPEEKSAIASVLLQEVNGYDTTKLPPADQAFVSQLQSQEGTAQ